MSHPMKLLIVTTVPESLYFFVDHIALAQANGLDVHVLSSPGPVLREFARRSHVQAHAVAMYRGISPFQDVVGIVETCTVLRTVRPDIVHAATPKGAFIGMIAAWMNKVPIRIFHIMGFRFMTTKGLKRRLLCWSERISSALSHKVVCVSHSVRRVAIAEGICRPDKIAVPANGSVNGVDAARFCPGHSEDRRRLRDRLGISEDAFVVGYVGRVVLDKGLTELAQAWVRLRPRFSTMRLLIVGRCEPQDLLPPNVEQLLRTDPAIHLAGELPDILQVYRSIDLLVLPTYREGFPVVLLEAAAMGLPVVATAVSGCVDAVQDGITGTLVPPYDPRSLADAIGQYASDEVLRRRHGAAARERVLKDFRPEDVAKALWQEYEPFLGEQPGSRLEQRMA